MTARATAADAGDRNLPFDPAPLAAQVHAALDSDLRERAPDQRLAFWKAVALGYGGTFETLAGDVLPAPSKTSP